MDATPLRARLAPLFGADPCHDLHHLDRVAKNSLRISRVEGGDPEVLVAAAYLHDLDRAGSRDALADADAHLRAIGFDPGKRSRVLEAVERHKDKSFAPGGKRPSSLEARILADADRLEAIGAIGIARAFAFGGLKGRPLWDGAPLRVPETYVSGAGGTTVQHFYDKLLRLRDDFNTAEGRRLAEERHAFLEEFLRRFFEEWDGAGARPPAR